LCTVIESLDLEFFLLHSPPPAAESFAKRFSFLRAFCSGARFSIPLVSFDFSYSVRHRRFGFCCRHQFLPLTFDFSSATFFWSAASSPCARDFHVSSGRSAARAVSFQQQVCPWLLRVGLESPPLTCQTRCFLLVSSSVSDPCFASKLAPRCLCPAWNFHFLLVVCLLGLRFLVSVLDFGWSAHSVVLVECRRSLSCPPVRSSRDHILLGLRFSVSVLDFGWSAHSVVLVECRRSLSCLCEQLRSGLILKSPVQML
jgi:hypothetical protein